MALLRLGCWFFGPSRLALLGDDVEQIQRLLFGVETDGQIELGLFEQSHGGTLYLDEISGFPIQQQKEILKMLLDGGITRVGGKQMVHIDARVLSSCSGDPKARISEAFCARIYITA